MATDITRTFYFGLNPKPIQKKVYTYVNNRRLLMKDKKSLLTAIIGIIGLILVTAGISYAWFSYTSRGTILNTITSGNIAFSYTESSQGITLADAMPMTDTEGKNQTSYFDFQITSRTTNYSAIPYVITAKVDSNSTDY